MDNDDAQIGRILSRREVLALFGGSSVALLAACAPGGALASPSPAATAQQTSAAATTAAAAASAAATALPSCIVRPALTEGPYFVDEKLNRSDIRSDPGTGAVRPGALLTLNFLVSRVSGSACTALSGAMVDVWHCDALGVYSDVGQRARPEVPARLPEHRRVGQREVHDDLSRLVPGSRGAHPLQDPPDRRRASSPRSSSSTTR